MKKLPFELVKPTQGALLPAAFLRGLEFDNDDERQYVTQVAKQASSRKTQIYQLCDHDSIRYGFVALSIATLNKQPCMVIDYLFTSKPYRKQIFSDLGNVKVSEFLVDFAVKVAQEIDERVPIHYISLMPAHDRLIKFYAQWDFKSLDKTGWFFVRI